jgi:hypothetical protein
MGKRSMSNKETPEEERERLLKQAEGRFTDPGRLVSRDPEVAAILEQIEHMDDPTKRAAASDALDAGDFEKARQIVASAKASS